MDKDSLAFKEACEACGAPLLWITPASVCEAECTFCAECAEGCGGVCPNCSTELRARPKRTQPIGRRRDAAHANGQASPQPSA